MFNFFSKPDSFIGTVFGIGSSSVGGALVRFEKGKLPFVIYTVREYISHMHAISPSEKEEGSQGHLPSVTKMVEALRRADLRLSKEGASHLTFTNFGKEKIKKAFCIFSRPWSESHAKLISIDASSEPLTVTEGYIDDLLVREEEFFEKDLIEKGRGRPKNDEYVPIGKDIIEMKVNGYPVHGPYGKIARTLDVAFFLSLVPRMILTKVEEALTRSHHLKDVQSFSFPVAIFSVMRDIHSEIHDFIFIDIAGEFTDISVAKGGVLVESSGFTLGRNYLPEKVSLALKEPFDVSVSLLEAYFKGHIEDALAKKIEVVLEEAKREWGEYLNRVLQDIGKRVFLPRSIFLIVGDFVPFFIKIVKEQKVGLSDVGGESFDVRLFNYDSVKNHVVFGKAAQADYFLAFEAVFVGKTLYK